jgi:hypothetical protein
MPLSFFYDGVYQNMKFDRLAGKGGKEIETGGWNIERV